MRNTESVFPIKAHTKLYLTVILKNTAAARQGFPELINQLKSPCMVLNSIGIKLGGLNALFFRKKQLTD